MHKQSSFDFASKKCQAGTDGVINAFDLTSQWYTAIKLKLDNFMSVISSQLVRQEELMAKLRDEITSLQDDVSKSTDQVLQENRRAFLSCLCVG